MTANDNPPSRPDSRNDLAPWPIVSPDEIVIAEWDWDMAYMGVYLKLEICNRSPYLVREAELRIDGRAQGVPGIATSREIRTGPLFPGVFVHEEIGIGARGGIGGVSFNFVSAHAVRLTQPDEMVPAAEYPALAAEILDVTIDKETPDPRSSEGEFLTADRTAIHVRIRNGGTAVVERARLMLLYFEAGRDETGKQPSLVANWIFDAPRREWDPYRLPAAPEAVCDPAPPLPPGQSYDFTLVHYGGGPHGWAGCREATSVEVCELKLRSAARTATGRIQ